MGALIQQTYWLDWDLTITYQQYQQHWFLSKHFDKWREKYAKDFSKADTPEKYMSMIAHTRHKESDSRVRWMFQFCDDAELWGNDALKDFEESGRRAPLAPGLPEFFPAFKEHLRQEGIEATFNIVSAGGEEFIRGNEAAKHVDNIFSGAFLFNNKGYLLKPTRAVGSFEKTEIILKYSKGGNLDEIVADDDMTVDYRSCCYIGDGFSDRPMFAMGQKKGGCTLAVRPIGGDEGFTFSDLLKSEKLLNRLNGACVQDYSEGGPIWNMLTRFAMFMKNRQSNIFPGLVNNYRKNRIKERQQKRVDEDPVERAFVEMRMQECPYVNLMASDKLLVITPENPVIQSTRADKAYKLSTTQ